MSNNDSNKSDNGLAALLLIASLGYAAYKTLTTSSNPSKKYCLRLWLTILLIGSFVPLMNSIWEAWRCIMYCQISLWEALRMKFITT